MSIPLRSLRAMREFNKVIIVQPTYIAIYTEGINVWYRDQVNTPAKIKLDGWGKLNLAVVNTQ